VGDRPVITGEEAELIDTLSKVAVAMAVELALGHGQSCVDFCANTCVGYPTTTSLLPSVVSK